MKRRRRTQGRLQDLEDEVQEWLKNKKGKSTSTFIHCRTSIIYFQEYLQSKYGKDTPISDFLDKLDANEELPRRNRRKLAETEINGFSEYLLKKELASGTIIQYINKVTQFLAFKNFSVNTSLLNIPQYIPVKKNRKHAWALEEMREFVDKARSVRDKAFIVCSLQSGLSVEDLLALDYGDIQKDLEAKSLPILIDLTRGKTAVPYKTFLGADAVHYLRIYLSTRRNLRHNSPLFTKAGSEERLTYEAIYKRIDELSTHMSFIKTWDREGWNPTRIHSLRSAFRSRLTGKTDRDLIEFFMGHNLGNVAKDYILMPEEELRQLYANVEKYIRIQQTSQDQLTSNNLDSKAVQERLNFLEGALEQLIPLMRKSVDTRIHIDFQKKQIHYPKELGGFTIQPPEKLKDQLALIQKLIGKDPLQIIQALSQINIKEDSI